MASWRLRGCSKRASISPLSLSSPSLGLRQAGGLSHKHCSSVRIMKGEQQTMPFTDGTIQQQFYHGTRADLKPGDLIAAGYGSNYGTRKQSSWVYLTGTLDAAVWGAELAVGEGRERIYIAEPTGPITDDPN